jgi:hypothetical protein
MGYSDLLMEVLVCHTTCRWDEGAGDSKENFEEMCLDLVAEIVNGATSHPAFLIDRQQKRMNL